MMKYKTTVAASLILLLSGLTAATHTGKIQANPVNETVLATNSSINGSSVSTNNLAFPVQTQGDTLLADVPLSVPPGTYTGDVELENNYSHSFTVQVQPYVNWSLQPAKIDDTINIGTSGKLTGQTLTLDGNTNSTIDLSLTGNVSQYLRVTDEVNVYPDIATSVVLQYSVRETTQYGLYNGTLHLNGSYNNSQQVPLSIRFRDNVTPVIETVSTPSFNATFPKNFTVKASDNLNISTVTAEILKETTPGPENTTVNETVDTLTFDKVPNTQTWTARPPGNLTGTFYVEGSVVDGAGNRANFSSEYTVEKLDAAKFNNSISLQSYRVESEILKKIGEIDRETTVDVTLEAFNQPLQSPNETWDIAVRTRDGEKFLREEGYTVTLEGPTPVYLKVYGSLPERFNARLSFNGVEEHVPINDLRFNGQYLNCKVPEKEILSVFTRNVTYSPVNSTNCENAGWNVSYFVSAKSVPQDEDLKDVVRTYFPTGVKNSLEENIEQKYEDQLDEKDARIENWRSQAGTNAFWRNIFLVVGLVGWGAFLWQRFIAPSYYYTRLKTTDLLSTDFLGGDDDEDGLLG